MHDIYDEMFEKSDKREKELRENKFKLQIVHGS
jgi:hypothetical protein